MPTLETLFSKLKNVKVIDDSIIYSHYIPIDLSISNIDLSEIDMKNSKDFETYIENHIEKNHAKVAFGGYNEERNLYKQTSLFDDDQADERNVHIGMDLWIKAKTPVLAALDGKVYGFDYNAGAGNYGQQLY